MAKNAASAGASSKTQRRKRRRRRRSAKRVDGKERRSQIWQAFQMQRKQDKKLLPYMIGALVGTAAVVTLALMWFLPWWMVLPFGIVIGALLAMIIFSRRVQTSVYKQAEGTPGAAAWSCRTTCAASGGSPRRSPARPTWTPSTGSSAGRASSSSARDARTGSSHCWRRRRRRSPGSSAIPRSTTSSSATRRVETPLRKLNPSLMKLPRNISAPAVVDLDNRLTALASRSAQAGLPKGPMPAGVKQRNMQRAMRRSGKA